MGIWIEKVVIHIGDKDFELSKEEVRKLYNELQELLHEQPFYPEPYIPPIQPIPMGPYPQPPVWPGPIPAWPGYNPPYGNY